MFQAVYMQSFHDWAHGPKLWHDGLDGVTLIWLFHQESIQALNFPIFLAETFICTLRLTLLLPASAGMAPAQCPGSVASSLLKTVLGMPAPLEGGSRSRLQWAGVDLSLCNKLVLCLGKQVGRTVESKSVQKQAREPLSDGKGLAFTCLYAYMSVHMVVFIHADACS